MTLGADECRFNELVLMDFMFLRDKSTPVLHIVDERTKFSAACLLTSGTSTHYIWEPLLKCWDSVYTGLPNRILVDQGSNFGPIFVNLARASGVEVPSTGIEAHSSLGICERYLAPLRNIWRKIKAESPATSDDLALQLSVQAMNDTVGPEGLMPSALVFGEYPSVSVPPEPIPPRAITASRVKLMDTARREMTTHMAQVRINSALKHAIPAAANQVYEDNQKVLVWREKKINNRVGE